MKDTSDTPTQYSYHDTGFWGLQSSDNEIRNGWIKFWSIVETLSAIVVFWIFTIYLQSFGLLYITLLLSPIFLLRSDASVADGVSIFTNGIQGIGWEQRRLLGYKAFHKQVWSIGLIVALAVSALLVMLSVYYIPSQGKLAFRIVFSWMFVFIFCINPCVASVAGLLAGSGPGPGGRVSHLDIDGIAPAEANFAWWIGGVPLLAFNARVISTVRHLLEGYGEISKNVWRLSLSTAPLTPPELIQDLPLVSKFRFAHLIALMLETKPEQGIARFISNLLMLFLVAIAWIIPAWVYRFSLKSTMWLWWILRMIGGGQIVYHGIAGARADSYVKFTGILSLVFSAITILTFFFGSAVQAAFSGSYDKFNTLPIVWIFFMPDWGAISILGATNLSTATLNLMIALIVNAAWVDTKAVPTRQVDGYIGVKYLTHLIVLRDILWSAIIFMTLLYIAALIAVERYNFAFNDWTAFSFKALFGEHSKSLLVNSH